MSTTTQIGLWHVVHDTDPGGGVVEIYGPDRHHIAVPFVVLEEFVGSVLRNRQIAALEQQSGRDWLTVRAGPAAADLGGLFYVIDKVSSEVQSLHRTKAGAEAQAATLNASSDAATAKLGTTKSPYVACPAEVLP